MAEVLATECTGLCGSELEVFQAVLGQRVEVSRTEHIIAGARRSAYRVCRKDRASNSLSSSALPSC